MWISSTGMETVISFSMGWADATLVNIEVNRTLFAILMALLFFRQVWRLVKLYRADARTAGMGT